MPDSDPSNRGDKPRRPSSKRDRDKARRPDRDYSAEESHRPDVDAPEESGDDTLQTGLTELNRRLRELREDLVGGTFDATSEQVPAEPAAPAQPPLTPAEPAEPREARGGGRVHLEGPPPAPDPQQRVHSILDEAQQMADEIMRNAHRQVAETQPQGAAIPNPVADATAQVANALRQTQELLGRGQELLASSYGVLEALEQSPAWQDPRAVRQAPRGWPPPPQTPLPPYAQPGVPPYAQPVAPPYPQPAPTPYGTAAPAAPQPIAPHLAPLQPGAVQPGAPEPFFEPVAGEAYTEETPSQPLVHHGQVTLTAGPLVDVAGAAVLERAIEHIPAVARARVKRFVEDRAVIEVVLSDAVMLADELRRVLPYPFEVQALGRSELDIVIATTPAPTGNGNPDAEVQQ